MLNFLFICEVPAVALGCVGVCDTQIISLCSAVGALQGESIWRSQISDSDKA